MSQLSFSSIPGFFDLDDTLIAAGEPLTDDAIQKISHNAKAGAVRFEEIYMGFFKHGDTVGTPASPVDGYSYARAEIHYRWNIYSTRAPAAGFVSGQATPPSVSSSQGSAGGGLDGIYTLRIWDINDLTGEVSINTNYSDGSTETTTNDGIMKVYAMCQRLSVNEAN